MTRAPRYEDFALGFTADPEDPRCFRVSIRQAPCPGPDGSFRLPFPAEELDGLLAGLEARIVDSGRGRTAGRHLGAAGVELAGPGPDEVGHRLFRALFRGEVRDRFIESRERARHHSDMGLRVRLVIDPEAPGGTRLASLPWELLYRRETRDHLSRNLWTPVVRFLLTRETRELTPLDDDLRILLVSANPEGSARLDLAGETAALEAAWSEVGLDVRHLENPSGREGDLRKAIRRFDPHVLHFMGHGALDERTGEGGLVLGERHGRPRVYTAAVLRDDVRAGSSLRFVCLNACTTGRLPRRQGQDPFSGLAASLVMAGVPAVVAMQFPVSDRAALAFSEGLYRALAAGDPVDAAVAEGRMAIVRQDTGSWEWATPALYLSVADGRVFSGREMGEAQKRNEGATAPSTGQKQNSFVAKGCTNVVQAETIPTDTMNIGGSDRSSSRRGR